MPNHTKQSKKKVRAKKTVAELERDIEHIKELMGNVHAYGYTVWDTQQIKEAIDKHDSKNEMLPRADMELPACL